jgi:hypothetical protein
MYNSAFITQSNYIPWKGYFDSIAQADVFVVYDDMQYTRSDWRNRNQIKTPQGVKWLTIPVEMSGKFGQKIKDTKIADPDWNRKHWEFIRNSYKKAEGFKDVGGWLEQLYLQCNHTFLSEVNLHFLQAILGFFKINTPLLSSSDFDLSGERNERLVNICQAVGATTYYSGLAAKSYIEEALFAQNKIELKYLDYSGYAEYPQVFPPFTHFVSIIDLLCNTGNSASDYLKFKP